jgi:hypothetical protein
MRNLNIYQLGGGFLLEDGDRRVYHRTKLDISILYLSYPPTPLSKTGITVDMNYRS